MTDHELVHDENCWVKSDILMMTEEGVTETERKCPTISHIVDSSSPPSSLLSPPHAIVVGGTKGHVIETIVDPSLLTLYCHYRWKMIPNCTGRYTCRDHHKVSTLSPLQLLEDANVGAKTFIAESGRGGGGLQKVHTFHLPNRTDRVMIVPLDVEKTVGLITFEKYSTRSIEVGEDNKVQRSYVHTLNTVSGFRRKLTAIGIQVTSENIVML